MHYYVLLGIVKVDDLIVDFIDILLPWTFMAKTCCRGIML